MKSIRKILVLVFALTLVFALSATAFAATVTKADGVDGPASITVQLPTLPETGYTANNTYTIYKVFDANLAESGDGITYTLTGSHTTAPDGFEINNSGNVTYVGTSTDGTLSDADIAAIKAYVTDADIVATVTTTADDTSFTVDGLPYGYYYIDTTTGTLITVDTTHPNAVVNDKNEIPPVDKKITGATSMDEDGLKALAQVGTPVTYTATIEVQNGAENYVFHDKMTAGLSYNDDMVVNVGGTNVDASAATFSIGQEGEDTVTVTFDNDYIASLADGTKITFTYTATITEDAVTRVPEKNTCYLTYGDINNPNSTPVKETETYNAIINVLKKDDKDQPLKGAGFVLKNSEDKYYTYDGTEITWVDSIDDADEHFSGDDGVVPAFTGLANGTYTLVEKTVPDGYNKTDDATFTIAEHDYTVENLEQSATVVNNEGPEMPSTGGIGTTVFYVVGAVLVVGAAIVLIARRRAAFKAN